MHAGEKWVPLPCGRGPASLLVTLLKLDRNLQVSSQPVESSPPPERSLGLVQPAVLRVFAGRSQHGGAGGIAYGNTDPRLGSSQFRVQSHGLQNMIDTLRQIANVYQSRAEVGVGPD